MSATIPPSSPGWSLENIEAKVRALTGMPSADQMTALQVNAYINNYLLYVMPHELKVQISNQNIMFKTVPGQNVYSFPGSFLTDAPGAYADGFPLIFYEDPDIFYQDWPLQYGVDNVSTGNGVLTNFAGNTQGFPIVSGSFFITDGFQVLQDSGLSSATVTLAVGNGGVNYGGVVTALPIQPGAFTAVGGIGAANPETFKDNKNGILIGSQGGSGTVNYTTGIWTLTFAAVVAVGLPIRSTYSVVGLNVLAGAGAGTLNIYTGAFTATFATAPALGNAIYSKYIAYQGNRPQGILFYNNQFQLMPVPDQSYQIQLQGFIAPTPLVAGSAPVQAEWGPLIAYGASLEIFADRGDTDNYDKFYPMLKRYENIALGRTVQQLTPMQSVPRF